MARMESDLLHIFSRALGHCSISGPSAGVQTRTFEDFRCTLAQHDGRMLPHGWRRLLLGMDGRRESLEEIRRFGCPAELESLNHWTEHVNFRVVGVPMVPETLEYLNRMPGVKDIADGERELVLSPPELPEVGGWFDRATGHGPVESLLNLLVEDRDYFLARVSELGKRSARVAVIDTGVDVEHPALRKTVADRISIPGDEPSDPSGHGTHVMGIVCGVPEKPSMARFTGIASGVAEAIDVQVADSKGTIRTTYLVAGIGAAVRSRADVITMSLGMPAAIPDGTSFLTNVLENAADRDIVICVSAGNSGPRMIHVPGDTEKVLCVGACDALGSLAPFSSRGCAVPGLDKPDVVAPGVDIISCRSRYSETRGDGQDNLMIPMSGTSMSTPIVAGLCVLLVALARKHGKSLSAADVRQYIKASASPGMEASGGSLPIPRIDRAFKSFLADAGVQNGVADSDRKRQAERLHDLACRRSSGQVFIPSTRRPEAASRPAPVPLLSVPSGDVVTGQSQEPKPVLAFPGEQVILAGARRKLRSESWRLAEAIGMTSLSVTKECTLSSRSRLADQLMRQTLGHVRLPSGTENASYSALLQGPGRRSGRMVVTVKSLLGTSGLAGGSSEAAREVDDFLSSELGDIARELGIRRGEDVPWHVVYVDGQSCTGPGWHGSLQAAGTGRVYSMVPTALGMVLRAPAGEDRDWQLDDALCRCLTPDPEARRLEDFRRMVDLEPGSLLPDRPILASSLASRHELPEYLVRGLARDLARAGGRYIFHESPTGLVSLLRAAG